MSLELISNSLVLIPDLQPSVPSYWHNVWVDALNEGGESNLTDPISVEMSGLSMFQFSLDVVQLDFFLCTSTKDVSVIRW